MGGGGGIMCEYLQAMVGTTSFFSHKSLSLDKEFVVPGQVSRTYSKEKGVRGRVEKGESIIESTQVHFKSR